MRLHNRNTYKERKIMILYASLFLIFISLTTFCLLWGLYLENWLLYLATVIFGYLTYMSFLFTELENNNYKVKFYYAKKEFQGEFNSIIEKYNIQDGFVIKNMKTEAKDCFYQYGKIDLAVNGLENWLFLDWLRKHAVSERIVVFKGYRFDYFLYDLLKVTTLNGDYKLNLNYLVNMYPSEEIIPLLNENPYIGETFLDKCKFLYNHTVFVDEKHLRSMYLETTLIIKGIIGVLEKEEFFSRMYNPEYYYTKDKYSAFTINSKEEKCDIYYVNLENGHKDLWKENCNSKNEAISFIKEEIASIEEKKYE